ncbi:MAG: purM [Gammaproteobacteria bacterium]|nr:purM [Gammaproteobacteria bacterium]
MQQIGNIPDQELFRTFNMGAGLVMVLDSSQIAAMQQVLQAYPDFKLYSIGEVVPGERTIRIMNQ